MVAPVLVTMGPAPPPSSRNLQSTNQPSYSDSGICTPPKIHALTLSVDLHCSILLDSLHPFYLLVF